MEILQRMKIDNFLNAHGRVSSSKSTSKWISKNFPQEFKQISSHTLEIGLKATTFSEEIYHYLNQLENPVMCKGCGKNKTKFQGLLRGYLDYCSSKCSNNSIEVTNKKEKTSLENYGVRNPAKSKIIIDKIRDTFINKYGGNPFSLKEFQTKIENTNLSKYGTKSPLGRDSSIRKNKENQIIEKFISKYSDFEILDFDTIKGGNAKLKCKKCKNVFEISKWNLHQRTKNDIQGDICTLCNPIGSTSNSAIEEFIRAFLKSKGIIFKEKDRKILDGKEIDFYIEDKKIAIEINGLFWHSEKFKENDYHLNKTIYCLDKGIFLVHVFEDEIMIKPDLVKSRLSSILGINDEKIFARKCDIREVNKKDTSIFLGENHIQGVAGSKIRLGLYSKNKLVSIMTFGELRKNMGSSAKDNNWELIRFCSLKETTVVGAASKILNYFLMTFHPEKVISYCDRRWSDGKFYEKIGFVKDKETRPNYFYIKNGLRENRYKYRKDVLVSAGYDPLKSESEIMRERKFLRIYDCGNFKFVLNKKGLLQ